MNFSEQLQDISTHLNSIIRLVSSEHNISFSQAQFLMNIPVDGISISEISNKLGVDISTMSRNINKLELLNYVKKKQNSSDKRIIHVVLTNSGHDMSDSLFMKFDHILSEAFSKIPLETQANLDSLLESLQWVILKNCEK